MNKNYQKLFTIGCLRTKINFDRLVRDFENNGMDCHCKNVTEGNQMDLTNEYIIHSIIDCIINIASVLLLNLNFLDCVKFVGALRNFLTYFLNVICTRANI